MEHNPIQRVVKNFERSLWGAISYEKFRKTLPKHECHFCKIAEDNYIILRTRFWTVIKNFKPYKKTERHLVVVLNRHEDQSRLDKISAEEWKNLINIRGQFSDCVFFHNAEHLKSVGHLHFQLIKPYFGVIFKMKQLLMKAFKKVFIKRRDAK